MRKILLLTLLLSSCIGNPVIPVNPPLPSVTNLQYRGVWYRPTRASFLAELMDTGDPFTIAKLDLDQNFAQIHNMQANVVIIRLADSDGFWGQYGGGVNYTQPQPQAITAMQTILTSATNNGLRVIFALDFSQYHVDVDDSPGAFNFIQGLIKPFAGDARIAGWLFDSEIDPQGRDGLFVAKYWNYFYSQVHASGSKVQFAGINMEYIFTDYGARAYVTNAKRDMSTLSHPDYLGVEWFDTPSYNFSNTKADLDEFMLFVQDQTFPPSHIILMSGGSNQLNNPGRAKYYTDIVTEAKRLGLAGIFVWHADAFTNTPCGLGVDVGQDAYAVFQYDNALSAVGCKQYPVTPWHWQNGSTWQLITTPSFQDGYGPFSFTNLRDIGIALRDAWKPQE